MIRLRLASFGNSSGDQQLPIVVDETIKNAVDRSLGGIPLDKDAAEIFQVLLNGHNVPPEMWEISKLKEDDNVLIAPRIKSGDSGQTFKQIAIIGITIGAGALFGPAGSMYVGSAIGASFVTAGVTILASLALNALIPPPNPKIDGKGSEESSQAYSITGQSNQTNKYGTVPKVYGKHRIFPTVAANPYIELEANPRTGELESYLYCIYDLGLGPMKVEDIRIGDTRITSFSDVSYQLVDFNRPAKPGFTFSPTEYQKSLWALNDKLKWYKGSVSSDQAAVVLEKDKEDGGPAEDYRVIRNSALNPDGYSQEIILSLACPQGLIGYSATGKAGSRTIDLEIYFAKVGTTDWKAFNDLNEVEDFTSAGGETDFTDSLCSHYPPDLVNFTNHPYTVVSEETIVNYSSYEYKQGYRRRNYGIDTGATQVILLQGDGEVGRNLYVNGSVIGVVASKATYPLNAAYSIYTLVEPILNDITIFTTRESWVSTLGYDGNEYVSSDEPYAQVKGLFRFKNPVNGKARLSGQTREPKYATFKFTPKNPGQYQVRIERIRTFATPPGYSGNAADSLTFTGISTRFDREPIVTDKRHTFIEVKIRATNQLNGGISNLSAVCTSILDVWNGSAWVKQTTKNPAWVFVDLLTGPINKRAIDKSRLHIPSIYEWAQHCDQVPTSPEVFPYTYKRFETNMVLDYAVNLKEIVSQVAGAAQASMNIVDGKYGVLIDKLRTTPVQIFTPRNSWGFSSTRSYTRKPHGVKVKWVDPNANWIVSEKAAYDDGYTFETATDLDEITAFACTNQEQAWRYGRYLIAQNRLRQETISLSVDFEHLVCTRGDYVQITQDVMKVGGYPARVKSVSGFDVTIDDAIETGPYSYGYVFRSSSTGVIHQGTLVVVDADTFTLTGTMPVAGDLIVIGVVDTIVFDCIVKSISPNDDLSATLTLVEKADAIYTSESTGVIPEYAAQISVTADAEYQPPSEVEDLVVADNAWECTGSGYLYYVDLDWNAPQGAAFEYFEVYVDNGTGLNLYTTTQNSYQRVVIDELYLDIEHNFKILAVSATGNKLGLGQVGQVPATPERKITPPSSIESLDIDITGEILQLQWPAIIDCDCDEYLIRYSPSLTATWESSIPLMRVDRNNTLAATQARTGTYLIKAVDFNGNESSDAALAITTIPNLFNLNFIQTIDDFPTLEGSMDRVEADTGALTLANSVVGGVETSEYYPDGYYYYKDLLDLGDIYSVRLQSLIEAEGYTAEDLMINWEDLVSVPALSSSKFSEWDVEAQYRTTEAYNVMSEWTQLSLVDPINEGQEDLWSPWRKFIIGDATGRIFQFRLRLVSRKVSVSPRVFSGIIQADMADRTDTYQDISAPDTGYSLAYSAAFKGPGTTPAIQITIDNAESGDYWTISNKTLAGFDIIFYDKTDTAVARQFDASVRGYGRQSNAAI